MNAFGDRFMKKLIEEKGWYYNGEDVTVVITEQGFTDMLSFMDLRRYDMIVTNDYNEEVEHLNMTSREPPAAFLDEYRIDAINKLFRKSKVYSKEDLIAKKKRKIAEIREAANLFEV